MAVAPVLVRILVRVIVVPGGAAGARVTGGRVVAARRGWHHPSMRDDLPSGPAAPLALDDVLAEARSRAREDRAAVVRRIASALIVLATAIGLLGQTARRERPLTPKVRPAATAPAH